MLSLLQGTSHRNAAIAPPPEYMVSDGYRSNAAGGSIKGPPSLRPVAGVIRITQARFSFDIYKNFTKVSSPIVI